ncbi:MAG: hypothetical protein AB1894_27340 [Chloroflexota bacterium]
MKSMCMGCRWRWRSVRLVVLLACLALFFQPGYAQAPGEALLYQEDFDSGQAQGWELEAGWQVFQEGDNYLLQGEGHTWARSGILYPGDFRLSFRLRLLRGEIHLVYRMNQTGRYFINFRQGGSGLHKQLWPDTFINDLAGVERAHRLGQWRQVEIIGQGSHLRLLVDGQPEWEYEDPDPLLFGSFAFETLDGSLAQVDDIQVFGPPPPASPTPDARLTWARTGGPLGGLGYDVRMRPDNPDSLYVTDAWAGVFTSADGGRIWSPSNAGITTRTGTSGDAIPVFCLTIDPHDPEIIWAGTQNVRGIFKSTDGGRNWTRMDNGVIENEGITFRGLAVDPRSSEIVYAAAELSSFVWNGAPRDGREFDMTAGVVYKTTNGGQNWSPIWRGENLARYIWIDPRNPEVLYVSTGIFDREAANSDPQQRIPGGEGVLKSTDGGRTWARANQGMENLYVGSLFMHPENPDILLAGTGNNQYYDGNGVYISRDGGGSWEHVLRDDNINAVEFAASDPQIAYAGSSAAIYRSQDGGGTWQRVAGGEQGWGPPGVRAGFPIDFQVDPRDPNRIFANEYGGGNFLSTDGGRTWVVASAGYTGAQVRDMEVDLHSGRAYAAARSGLFASSDGGASWAGLNWPPAASMEWYAVAVDPSNGQRLLAANNWNASILHSTDGGRSWQPVTSPLPEGMAWRRLAFAPSDASIVYAGSSAFFSAGTFSDNMPAAGIYRSQDGGVSWSAANDGLSQDANVTHLAVAADNPQQVYAATGNHGLLISRDGGQSWSLAGGQLPSNRELLSVALHPHDSQVVLAGLVNGGVYRSLDGGATWSPAVAGLNPEASVTDIVFDLSNPQVLYLADVLSGVYRSTDGAGTWLPLSSGLRTRAVNKLALTADGLHLYAATEGEGVFRLDLDGQPPLAPSPTAAVPLQTPVPPVTSAPQATISAPAPGALPTATLPESQQNGPCWSGFALPLALAALSFTLKKGKRKS